MAETLILLAIKKIGIALGNEAANQATAQFAKYVTQLSQLQSRMGRVMRELRVIHDFLCQMNIRNHNNQVYEGWLVEVRKIVYVIEDMVDEYLYLVGREHDVRGRFYLKKVFKKQKALLSLNKIASTVKETEDNLRHISQTKERWVPTITSSRDRESSSQSLREEDNVGIEYNKQTLVQWLGDDELARSVIVLHGMGGLGKTTLAATVYNEEREKFDCRAWVLISQTYTRKGILKSLIHQLFRDKQNVPSNIACMGLKDIQETLKRFLEQKKYLIILDDVWTPKAYTDLFGALTSNLKGSRIIITTRNANIAHLASQDRVLTLQRLSEDESWELFCRKAFPDHECPVELEALSEQIVGKCEGLPVAIISIGSVLLHCKDIAEWKRIHDQLSWELINNSMLKRVRDVLHLSFINLPTYLKSCFLYCSLFPEDYLLTRKKLIRLWLAEGFIEKRGESTVEEVAEGYINELVQRSMLQLIGRNSFGRIKSFRMNNIVRELAIDLCQRECLGIAYKEWHDATYWNDARRLVIHILAKDIHQSISSVHRLRSVIALDSSMPSSTLLPLIANKSRYMSILELSGLPIETVPDAIGDLFNLRHLGLRDSKVKLLPKSIEKLSSLLTLDLSRSDIHELPLGIVKLKKLRHLFAEKVSDRSGRDFRCRTGVCIPKGLANLIDLQTLQALEAQDESVGQLGDLRQLRSIRICNVKRVFSEHLCASLVQMRFLSFLELAASDENEVLELNHLDPLPPNLQKLGLRGRLAEGTFGESPLFQTNGQNLYSLHLYWSQLREDPLPCLSRLSTLTDLWLTRAYSGEQLVFLARWFPKLKTLVLRDLPNLKRLEIKHGAMASLEDLTLVNLNSMTEVPPGIEFLMPLKYLGFEEITPEFLTLLHECPRIGGMRLRYTLRD